MPNWHTPSLQVLTLWMPKLDIKGTVSRKLRHRLLYIIQKLFFMLLTQAIKSNFFVRIFAQFLFKINGALSTMPLKFSVNLEEYLLKFSASHISFETSELQRHI